MIVTTAGGALVGAQLGAIAAPLTAGLSIPTLYAAGAAVGLVAGYLSCPAMTRNLKEKVEQELPMTETEVQHATQIMGVHSRTHDPQQAASLFSAARVSAANQNKFGNFASASNTSRPGNFGNHLDHPHHQSRAIAAATTRSSGKKA